MLKVNLASGETLSFDLEQSAELSRWQLLQADDDFQASIRGMGIYVQGEIYTCPRPTGDIRPVTWDAEIIYDRQTGRVLVEQFVCYYDHFALRFSVHRGRSSVRVRTHLSKPGKRVLRPPRVHVG